MPRVYSYLRFSDPRQAAGSSADRQAEYARRWAAERGLVLDESLSLRDEGLSAYHQRHVKTGALGIFLRAVEDGHVEPGSVLIVEGLDRLSRAEPIQAQAQLAQIVNAGITVVTASDGKEYNRARLKAQPMDLVYSLLVMIRAHEESDTKSKRVRAAIRRQCEAWQAGTWRGVIRNGKDPHWVRLAIRQGILDSCFELVPERAEALRLAVALFLDGKGSTQIMRELAARGMTLTDSGSLTAAHLYKTLRKRLLIGERQIEVGGEAYALAGYYPALLTEAEFDALQLAVERRHGRRGVGEIPSIITGMGIAVCGYCGGAIVSQNIMGRARQQDGRPHPGHRRLGCSRRSNGRGCSVGGSIQAAPVERALIAYCASRMRLAELLDGGSALNALRADIAAARTRLARAESRIDRLTRALAEDDNDAPAAVLRQIRTLETDTESERRAIAALERELGAVKPAVSPDIAEQWLALFSGVEALDVDARLQARELARASFSRIVLWHCGADHIADAGKLIFEMEITARGGGSVRLRCDRETGGAIPHPTPK